MLLHGESGERNWGQGGPCHHEKSQHAVGIHSIDGWEGPENLG